MTPCNYRNPRNDGSIVDISSCRLFEHQLSAIIGAPGSRLGDNQLCGFDTFLTEFRFTALLDETFEPWLSKYLLLF